MSEPLESAELPAVLHRNISNSEVTTWLSCVQQYVFAFMLNLAPKLTPKQLARGTLGHLAFEYYITARLGNIPEREYEGNTFFLPPMNHEDALHYSEKAFTEALNGGVDMATVMETKMLYLRYQSAHNGWPEWELLGTEQYFEMPITESFTIPMRYDLMVRDIASNRILIGDFKFTYDFWQPIDHEMNGQMSKYIAIMNSQGGHNGHLIDGGFLEEVRTRPLGKEKSADHKNLWRRTRYWPTAIKKRNMIKQHVAASLQVMEFRNMSPEDQEAATIPVLNKHGACKFCNFKELCNSKLSGKDITYDIEIDYVQNTYGYNSTLPLELEELM